MSHTGVPGGLISTAGPAWAALSWIRQGLMIFDRTGVCLFANPAAMASPAFESLLRWAAGFNSLPSGVRTLEHRSRRANAEATSLFELECDACDGIVAISAINVEEDGTNEEYILAALPPERPGDAAAHQYLARRFGLTPGETDVLGQLIAGLVPKAVALARNVSESTVRSQIRSIIGKLGVSSIRQAIAIAERVPKVRDGVGHESADERAAMASACYQRLGNSLSNSIRFRETRM
ncbi:MAG: helix-turn-helix transcriptional regulator [Burkholderiaceae bacterium]